MILVESHIKYSKNIPELIGYCVYDDIDMFEIDIKSFAINMATTNPKNISAIETEFVNYVKDIKVPIDRNTFLHYKNYKELKDAFRIVTNDKQMIKALMNGKRKLGKYLIHDITYMTSSAQDVYEEFLRER